MYAFGGVLLQVRPCSSRTNHFDSLYSNTKILYSMHPFSKMEPSKFPRLTTMQRHPGTSRSPTMSRHPIGRSCENVGRKLQQIDLTQVCDSSIEAIPFIVTITRIVNSHISCLRYCIKCLVIIITLCYNIFRVLCLQLNVDYSLDSSCLSILYRSQWGEYRQLRKA